MPAELIAKRLISSRVTTDRDTPKPNTTGSNLIRILQRQVRGLKIKKPYPTSPIGWVGFATGSPRTYADSLPSDIRCATKLGPWIVAPQDTIEPLPIVQFPGIPPFFHYTEFVLN
jgi:hypothetical protein